MKRERRECDYEIFPIRTIFAWRICRKCKNEFRRENGWALFGPPIFNGHASKYWLCSDCAPTIEDAILLANTRPWMGKRPSFPGAQGGIKMANKEAEHAV